MVDDGMSLRKIRQTLLFKTLYKTFYLKIYYAIFFIFVQKENKADNIVWINHNIDYDFLMI